MANKEFAELISPGPSAILVIDLQNDFCHSEGAMAKLGKDVSLMQRAAYNTQKFLPEARRRKIPVIFIRARIDKLTNSPAWLRKRGKNEFCVQGTWGENFFEVVPMKGETVVVKYRYSAFVGTNLDLILRSQGIRTLILTGVGTSVCVESTARDGFQLDYHIVLLSDCMGSSTLKAHKRALEVLEEHFGYVISSKDLVKAWG